MRRRKASLARTGEGWTSQQASSRVLSPTYPRSNESRDDLCVRHGSLRIARVFDRGHGFAALLTILALPSCGADGPADENAPADIVLLGGTIRAAFEAQPADEWILGGDWDHELWPEAPLPRREWADSLTPDHPVMVSRLDGHMALANSVALRAVGITRATPDPPGGTIVRSPDSGEPTGVLNDEAMELVFRVVPEPAEAARDSAFLRAQEHALSRGVTMIHDMGDWSDLETYRRARDRGALAIRVYSFLPLSSWERLKDFVRDNGRGDDQLRWGGLKGFVDGSLGSTTAWFYAPYDDEPATAGLLVRDTAAIAAAIRGADAAGLHVAVHAIGDRANDWLLGAFRAAAEASRPTSSRIPGGSPPHRWMPR